MDKNDRSHTVKLDRALCQDERQAMPGRRLLAEVVADCGASEATLWLVARDEAHLEAVLNHGPQCQVLEQLSVPINDSVVGMVAHSGNSVSIGPEDDHNPTIDRATGIETQAMIASPVYVGDDRRGVLSAINPIQGRLFPDGSLETLKWKGYLAGLLLSDWINA